LRRGTPEGAWRLRGHGLSAPELDPALLDIEVKRTAGAGKDGRTVDSVTGVADASHSEVFAEAATIGALWTSLPEVSELLPPLNRIAPGGTGFEARWLRPSVGGVALSSLLTWWTLLFGLSMLARYEPAGWMRALDYDSSELAAPLDRLLDIGLASVPDLVLAAIAATPEAPPQQANA
jgi:hypothetical protein